MQPTASKDSAQRHTQQLRGAQQGLLMAQIRGQLSPGAVASCSSMTPPLQNPKPSMPDAPPATLGHTATTHLAQLGGVVLGLIDGLPRHVSSGVVHLQTR